MVSTALPMVMEPPSPDEPPAAPLFGPHAAIVVTSAADRVTRASRRGRQEKMPFIFRAFHFRISRSDSGLRKGDNDVIRAQLTARPTVIDTAA
jgi:hypothetical protein